MNNTKATPQTIGSRLKDYGYNPAEVGEAFIAAVMYRMDGMTKEERGDRMVTAIEEAIEWHQMLIEHGLIDPQSESHSRSLGEAAANILREKRIIKW